MTVCLASTPFTPHHQLTALVSCSATDSFNVVSRFTVYPPPPSPICGCLNSLQLHVEWPLQFALWLLQSAIITEVKEYEHKETVR